MLPDPIGKIFAPFCAPDETVLRAFNTGLALEGKTKVYLFAIPTGNQDGAIRSPTLLIKSTKATENLVQGDGSGCGIGGP